MADARGVPRRLTTETKSATKTSEFRLALAVILLILISAFMIKGGDTEGGDEFIARQAWLYVAIITGAYAVGRGLAKSGVREYPDDADEGRDNRGGGETRRESRGDDDG